MKTFSEMNFNNKAEVVMRRSRLYGFLARIYRAEVREDVLEQLRNPELLMMLKDTGIKFEEDFHLLRNNEQHLINELALEYNRLFIGPGSHISPHESVHRERNDREWGRISGAYTDEVRTFIKSSELEYDPEYTGLPDDISIEFDFMQQLVKNEAEAWKSNDSERAKYFVEIEQDFLYKHLLEWVPCFCDKILAMAKASCYREIAKTTKNILEAERKCSDSMKR